jgi:uncharacterized protein (TIGR03084 family)
MTLLGDLAAEQADLDAVLGLLGEADWRTPTPAEGWDVRDSVAHLAYSEDLATIALTDTARFQAILDDPVTTVAAWTERGRRLSGPEVIRWWHESRGRTIDALGTRAERDRVPWAAGPMSAVSFATARLMETWAHGQDVRDALGLPPSATVRLRHVADLGVRTRAFSYRVRGLEPPAAPVRVELVHGEDRWTWGEGDAHVRGTALDFCMVVTQRSHPNDTTLVIEGKLAREWMSIAQAFAGPPTGPRERSKA